MLKEHLSRRDPGHPHTLIKGLSTKEIRCMNPCECHTLDALLRRIFLILEDKVIELIFINSQALQHIIKHLTLLSPRSPRLIG
jgi:hypothetical protein